MILSVSRRTDIPAFYGDWFINRLREGYVYVRNPFNYHQVSKILLSPENVDCIVFWTKDAEAFWKHLDEIDKRGYKYYFQYTITPYNKNIESRLRDKFDIINNFKRLSNRLGKDRVLWRYDPILFTDEIDFSYHIEQFQRIASLIAEYTQSVTISFLDDYSKSGKAVGVMHSPSEDQMLEIFKKFVDISTMYNLKIKTCAEIIEFVKGIEKASCIDKTLIENLLGMPIDAKKDKGQRRECLCIESVDIGEYDTCKHLCKYCYANGSEKKIMNKCSQHDAQSPLLIGQVLENDIIKERYLPSIKKLQKSFFD